MLALKDQLRALDPPLKHQLEYRGDTLHITLIDPTLPAKVTRTLNVALVRNTELLYVVLRDAVNELRAQGCHALISERELYPDEAAAQRAP